MAEKNEAVDRKYVSIKGSQLPQETQAEKIYTIGYREDSDGKESIRYYFTDILVQERGNDKYKTLSQDAVTKELVALEQSIGNLETDMNDRIDKEIATLNKTISDTKDELNGRITEEVSTLNTRITTEVGTLNKRIDTEVSTINTRIDAVKKELDDKIDNNVDELYKAITDAKAELNKRITDEVSDLNKRLDDTDKKVDDNHAEIKQLVEDYKAALSLRIDTLSAELHKKIDDNVADLKQRLDDFHAELTEKVEKAQQTADKAEKDAAAAQQSADEAQATADKGVRDAADAQYTADLAVQKADRAQDTADEAHTKADNNKASIEGLVQWKVDVIVQETGGQPDKVMSQKAVTDELAGKQETLVSTKNLATVDGYDLLKGGNVPISYSRAAYMFGRETLYADENGVIKLPDDMQQFIFLCCRLPLFSDDYTLDQAGKTLTLDLSRFPLIPEKDRFMLWYIKENTSLPVVKTFEAIVGEAMEIDIPFSIDTIQFVIWERGFLFPDEWAYHPQTNKIVILRNIDIDIDRDRFLIVTTI